MKVGVIMGSVSDYEVMADAVATLEQFGVDFEKRVVSAHRTPDLLCEYAKTAKARGIGVIIAGAGGAAHLPGMVASMTTLPVVGVPVKSRALNGLDSLLSLKQTVTTGTTERNWVMLFKQYENVEDYCRAIRWGTTEGHDCQSIGTGMSAHSAG